MNLLAIQSLLTDAAAKAQAKQDALYPEMATEDIVELSKIHGQLMYQMGRNAGLREAELLIIGNWTKGMFDAPNEDTSA